jgi:NHLM bacteriocin system ABC transporter peptidase/ATP-binding protein
MSRLKNVPVIPQMEEVEGGASCLAMVLGCFGKWVPLDQIRTACGVSRDGTKAEDIVRAAEGYGLTCKMLSPSAEELEKTVKLPAVLMRDNGQWTVLCGFRKNKAFLVDPARGRTTVFVSEFRKHYAGVCLEMQPGKDFVADGKPNTLSRIIYSSIRRNYTVLRLVIVTGMLAGLCGILSPVFTRVFTDSILSGDRAGWYRGFIYAFGALILFQLAAAIVNQVTVIRATGKIAALSNASYMRHLLRLPMAFFARRKAADLANRQEENNTIANTMIGQMTPLLLNLVMLLFYLIVMAQYNLLLTAVGVCTIIVDLLIAKRLGRLRREIGATQGRDIANMKAATVTGIDMIQTIKATGSENGYFERWSGFHAASTRAKTDYQRRTKYLMTAPIYLQELFNYIVMFIGFWLIIQGNITAGLLLTFLQFMKAIAQPLNQLLEAGETLEAMGASVERIQDVMDYPEEENIHGDTASIDLENIRKLSGRIEMNHVTFGYSKYGEPLLRDFNLALEPGKRIALVGASGSGKSTVTKLLTGLYQPWDGEIRFDGKLISEIPRAVFKASLSMVDQDIALFNDTIANNIRMWDTTIEDYDMILAARDAGIHDQIISRKGGYQMMLKEGGKNLSGGERQRIEIARVLAADPSILILDEATSALDARTEFEISEYVRSRGITCVIIAHRLSTIRDCDEIIVLERGHVTQRGTHEELMNAGGYYEALIRTA